MAIRLFLNKQYTINLGKGKNTCTERYVLTCRFRILSAADGVVMTVFTDTSVFQDSAFTRFRKCKSISAVFVHELRFSNRSESAVSPGLICVI